MQEKQKNLKVLALIPARSGSKTLPHKNIRPLNGKPLLAYSIEHAQQSHFINRIILTTDSEEYAALGRQYGAETPFLRPAELAQDFSLDWDVFYHALTYLKEQEHYQPDIVVHLRPTYPIRNPAEIDDMVQMLLNNPQADSVRSVSPAKENPFKMWTWNEKGVLSPICKEIKDCYNMPRQQLPTAYYQNASIDVMRSSTILDKKSMTGDVILGYLMKHHFDIDTEDEFFVASQYLDVLQGKKTFCFDIDGVIADTSDTTDYSKSTPCIERIKQVRQLYEYGNKIILFTARGYTTGKDWTEVTKRQMQEWGVPYTELKLGKPAAQFYVDDHALTLKGLENLMFLLKVSSKGE